MNYDEISNMKDLVDMKLVKNLKFFFFYGLEIILSSLINLPDDYRPFSFYSSYYIFLSMILQSNESDILKERFALYSREYIRWKVF